MFALDLSLRGEPSLFSYTISLELETLLVFLAGDLRIGFVRGFPEDDEILLDRSVEISDPLLPPPEVESSAPLLNARELFITVVDLMITF